MGKIKGNEAFEQHGIMHHHPYTPLPIYFLFLIAHTIVHNLICSIAQYVPYKADLHDSEIERSSVSFLFLLLSLFFHRFIERQ